MSIERCIREQAECAAYRGPDLAGARAGAADWIMEETLIRREYPAFLERRAQAGAGSGFKPIWIPDKAFDFQQALLDWALWLGRGAIFADCGMGKTLIQLAWAENVVRYTNRPVLTLTPLAV